MIKIVAINLTNNVTKSYELLHSDHISADFKSKLTRFWVFYCKNLNIKIIVSPFYVGYSSIAKDAILKSQKYFVDCKSVCPGCNACCIVQTVHHLTTKIKEHFVTQK